MIASITCPHRPRHLLPLLLFGSVKKPSCETSNKRPESITYSERGERCDPWLCVRSGVPQGHCNAKSNARAFLRKCARASLIGQVCSREIARTSAIVQARMLLRANALCRVAAPSTRALRTCFAQACCASCSEGVALLTRSAHAQLLRIVLRKRSAQVGARKFSVQVSLRSAQVRCASALLCAGRSAQARFAQVAARASLCSSALRKLHFASARAKCSAQVALHRWLCARALRKRALRKRSVRKRSVTSALHDLRSAQVHSEDCSAQVPCVRSTTPIPAKRAKLLHIDRADPRRGGSRGQIQK